MLYYCVLTVVGGCAMIYYYEVWIDIPHVDEETSGCFYPVCTYKYQYLEIKMHFNFHVTSNLFICICFV